MATLTDATRESLQKIREFDPETLSRQEELGSTLSFDDAIAPANRLIELYKQLSIPALEDFPNDALKNIRDRANSDLRSFQQILTFNPKQGNPTDIREALIKDVVDAYSESFRILHPLISYSAIKTADFKRIENDAHSALDSIKGHVEKTIEGLVGVRTEADAILEDVRLVAAESGVSQQAIYFKEEAQAHFESSNTWRLVTIWIAIALGLYAVGTLFIHNIPLLEPKDIYQSIQLTASKVLIFAVFSYMLMLAAKNFLSHKHNEIVNKHRQNALMTFKALVDASGTDAGKEVILSHASSCIFSPHDTGYIKASGDGGGTKSVIELLPNSIIKGDG